MIKVYWADEAESIIQLDYFDPIETWEEYEDAVRESITMARVKRHKVHFIHNPGSTSMPGGNAFPHVRKVIDLAPVNTGYVVMVIGNMFARRVMQLSLRLTLGADNFVFVGSLKEAYTKLMEDQQSV